MDSNHDDSMEEKLEAMEHSQKKANPIAAFHLAVGIINMRDDGLSNPGGILRKIHIIC